MTSTGEELYVPVKTGFDSDEAKHRRNGKAMEDFFHSPFISSAHILDATIDTAHITDASITNAKIESLEVDKLTAGTLNADVLIASKLSTAESGQRVEIDSNGIRLTDGTTDTVNIPVVGSATFNGGITATGLDVTGNASFRGAANTMEVGSAMTLGGSVSTPTAPPTISWVYDESLVLTGGFGYSHRGLKWDATNSLWTICSPGDFTIEGYNAAGVRQWQRTPNDHVPAIHYKPYGAVNPTGGVMWSAAEDDDTGKHWLLRYVVTAGLPVSGSAFTKVDITADVPKAASIIGTAYDGTRVIVAWLSGSNNLELSKFNASTGAFVSTTELEASVASRYSFTDVEYRSVSAAHYWLTRYDSTTGEYSVRAYSTAPAHVSAADFTLPSSTRGIAHDGTQFWTQPTSQDFIRKHTNWTSASTYEHVAYSWFKTTGTKETPVSPESITAVVQRARLRVSSPALPGDADNIRVYVVENSSATAITATNFKLQTTSASTTAELTAYNSGGAADSASNNFATTGTAAAISSAGSGAWTLTGANVMKLPTSTAAPGSPVEGQIYHNTTTHKAQVYDGTTWQNLF